jgi:Flp pilus assembly protein TadD
MLSTVKFRDEVVWSTAAFVIMALSLVLAGCGGDGPRTATGGRIASDDAPTEVTKPQLPPEIETASVETEPTEVAIEPEPPLLKQVSYEEAESVFFERRYSEAVKLFTVYSETRPENPWGHYMLGLSSSKAGEYDGAEAAFQRAIELDPQHVKSFLNLARVYLDTERPDDALVQIEEAVVIDPGSSVAFRLEGRAHHQLGGVEEAMESYRQAILVDGQDAWSMNNLGLILIEQERFIEALPPLARAVELRDDVAVFQNNLGMALERTGYFTLAEQAYKSAVAIDGLHEKAYANLGRVEGLEDEAGLEAVDLGDLAQNFMDEVEGWRGPVALETASEFIELEPIELDAIVISEADTTESKIEK